jgi:phage tail sheath gpL-like
MSVSYNLIPNNLLVPFVAVEIDNSRADQGPALLSYRVLLIGQKTAGGTATADSLVRVTSADQVLTLAGRGSILHRMAMRYFQNNSFTETFIAVLADNGAGVQATGTLTVTGPATAAGTVNLYLGGTLVQVGVASGDSANSIAAAINTAINANLDLPVTSGVSTNVVTVTFRHKGLVGNDFDLRANYQDGEKFPAGVSIAFVAMSGGTTAPSVANLIANLGDMWFQIWGHPYTDATTLTALETELASRFGPLRMIDGFAITAAMGTQGTLGTLGDSRNSPHSEIFSQPGEKPLMPSMEFAAGAAARIAFAANDDPARPFQTLPVFGVLPPAEIDLFTISERNLLLGDGISTSKAVPGGGVQIERAITTYQTSASGATDKSYKDATTMLTLLYLRYSFRTRILTRYPRHKLGNDGGRFGPGQAVMTPSLGKAEAIAWFRDMEELGLVENFDDFKANLVVERNTLDPNRLDFLLPPNLINQLIVSAVKLQFRL